MPTSLSKITPQIAGGTGDLSFAPIGPRYIMAHDIGALNLIKQRNPGAKIILRTVRDNEGEHVTRGRQGGIDYANQQLRELDANNARGAVWAILGGNEHVATGGNHIINAAFSRGHAETIIAAGYVAIELNIAVGNIEKDDLVDPEDQEGLFSFFMWAWHPDRKGKVLAAYHSYFSSNGPDWGWIDLAGRYQAITGWLKELGLPSTHIPRWAITEGGYERLDQDPLSESVWKLITRRQITESQAINAYLRVFALWDEDPLIAIAAPYTYYHPFDPHWKFYDLALHYSNSGQPWHSMLAAHATKWENPGMVNNPPDTAQPTFPRQARITATNGLRVRLTPDPGGIVIGSLAFNPDTTKFDVKILSVQNGWARSELKFGDKILVPGASDPDAAAYCASEFLQFAP